MHNIALLLALQGGDGGGTASGVKSKGKTISLMIRGSNKLVRACVFVCLCVRVVFVLRVGVDLFDSLVCMAAASRSRTRTLQVLEEADRSLHDALCVVRSLVKKRFLIAGGGERAAATRARANARRGARWCAAWRVGATRACARAGARRRCPRDRGRAAAHRVVQDAPGRRGVLRARGLDALVARLRRRAVSAMRRPRRSSTEGRRSER